MKEGDSVTGVPEILKDEEVEWRFNDTRIARVIENNVTYDDAVRFTDRLEISRSQTSGTQTLDFISM